jgi:hypothetical protein
MVLPVLDLCLIFVAALLAAKGLPIARPIIQTMVLVVVLIVGIAIFLTITGARLVTLELEGRRR